MATISLLSLMGFGTSIAFADTASVVNNVSVTANTGGNSNGHSSASIHIEQSVNGIAQPPVDITTSTASGSISVQVNSQIRATGTSTTAAATSSVKIADNARTNFLASFGSFFANFFGFLKFKL